MNGKEITSKLQELNTVNEITCTEVELGDYIKYGLLMQDGDKYINRYGKTICVNVLKTKNYRFSIDLSGIIHTCDEIALKEKINRIYCMTEKTFNKYKEQHLIITKSNINYYRLFENELWRVVIV